jgi:undecaprenyl-diphosphatase
VTQLAAALALALADRAPADRRAREAGPLDHGLIGIGQAIALIPGVSRGGATLTAARARRFDRGAAALLSRRAALPVMLAAAALKGLRASRGALPRELARPFAAGFAGAFVSALAARGLLAALERARSYAPFAVYRAALAVLVLARRRD